MDRSTYAAPPDPRIVGILIGASAAVVAVRFPGVPPWLNLSAVFVVAAVLYVCVKDFKSFLDIRLTSVDYLLSLYVFLRVFTDLVDASTLAVSIPLASIADAVVILCAYATVRAVVRSVGDAIGLLGTMIYPAFVVAFIAVLQLLDIGQITAVLAEHTRSGGLNGRLERGWSEIRATSTIGHWTALGGYLVCMTAVTCALLLSDDGGVRTARVRTLILATLLMGALATLTFAPIVVVCAIIGFTLYRLRDRAGFMIGAIAAPSVVLLVLIAPQLIARFDKQVSNDGRLVSEYSWLPESIAFRVDVWVREALPAANQRLLTGWGSDVYGRIGQEGAPPELHWMSPESEWVRTLVSGGAILLLIQLCLIAVAVRWTMRASRLSELNWCAPVTWALIGLVCMSIVHSHFTNRGVPLAIWPVVAAVVSAAVVYRTGVEAGGTRTGAGRIGVRS
ncbi:O-antigen ligase family protein [Gordonia sp. BP-119]|uniref:O-antigen ligase family protein n=1 Tax=Gordonia sp. BP-119 TaxID=2812553 RepID=UPI001963FD44|nr:O-antigen ligase family protein [Gordonia sp. BP-119]MBN0974524.1 hypothetical protein [Gordonia sp. BP-119]MBN0984472.1 hypothetical protein [Gordonia sp. BP-94]